MQSASAISPKDIIDIAIRRRWYILTPIFLALIFGIYYAFTAPKIYEATTLVMVEPQQVPKDYVRSVVTEDAESLLGMISQQVLSRTNLERIINTFGLMPQNNPNVYMEDVVNAFKGKVQMRVVRNRKGPDAFSISYKDKDPQQVMEITNALASIFIEANSQDREYQATGTSDFLEEEQENIRKRLLEMEAEIKQYREQYMGELPEQLNSNLSRLQGLQNQLIAKETNLREIQIRIAELENENSTSADGTVNPYDVDSLERQLTDLLMRYTENHPDVMRLKMRIAELKQGAQGSKKSGTGSTRRIDELKSAEFSLKNQIASLNSQMQLYQSRVEETPKREQELISLKRDYNNMERLYDSLLKRKLESEVSISMERKQKGEQFQIIDPAQLPKRSVEPDLKRIFMMTMAVGFGLGCGLAYLLEFSDSSYRKPEKIEEDFRIPVIATIPAVYTQKAVYKKRLEMGLCGFFALITVALIGVFSFVSLSETDQALESVKRYLSL
jgi:polysaccharide chain length determinant protein (PEP-CTERM system associated)